MSARKMYDDMFECFLKEQPDKHIAYLWMLASIQQQYELYICKEVDGWWSTPNFKRAAFASFPMYSEEAAVEDGRDHLGDLYAERVLAPSVAKRLGIFLTPPEVVRNICASALSRAKELAEKENRPIRVLDPAAGTGRFLMEARRQLPFSEFPDAEILGVEKDITMYRTAVTNFCIFNTRQAQIIQADTLIHETDPDTENGRHNWKYGKYGMWEEHIHEMKLIQEGIND